MDSYAENVSIWWRQHAMINLRSMSPYEVYFVSNIEIPVVLLSKIYSQLYGLNRETFRKYGNKNNQGE